MSPLGVMTMGPRQWGCDNSSFERVRVAEPKSFFADSDDFHFIELGVITIKSRFAEFLIFAAAVELDFLKPFNFRLSYEISCGIEVQVGKKPSENCSWEVP